MKPRIKVLTLGVSDLGKSLVYYRDGMGMPTEGITGTEFEGGAVVFFNMNGGLILALYPKTELAKDAKVPVTGPSSAEFSIGHNVNSKEEVDAVMEQAKRAKGFDMKVIYYSRTRRPELEAQYGLGYANLPDLLRSADFVSLHTPLTQESHHFIGEPELRMMKPTAVLINTARGPVVDPKALYIALKENWIYAAGLDVTEPEPISDNDPLLTLDNVIITPHIGSAAVATRRRTMLLAARNLVAGLKGERLETWANAELYQARRI